VKIKLFRKSVAVFTPTMSPLWDESSRWTYRASSVADAKSNLFESGLSLTTNAATFPLL